MENLIIDFYAIFHCYRYELLLFYPQDTHASDTKQGSIQLSLLWCWPSYFRYSDIAKHALDVVRCKSLDATQVLDTHKISESADRPEGFDG